MSRDLNAMKEAITWRRGGVRSMQGDSHCRVPRGTGNCWYKWSLGNVEEVFKLEVGDNDLKV